MIKTLRIASIIAVVLAAVFFVFPVVFGVRRDEQAEQFLKSPGVIEGFSKAKGQKRAKSGDQVSPLVKQAEAFALYLNPPKPKEPTAPSRTVKSERRPKTVSPKFELIGTSFYASHPELSLALVDEPGKGFRWVRQASEVGHLIIEQVKDGVVVVRDGKRTFELVAERPEKTELVKGTFPISSDTTSSEEPLSRKVPLSSEEPLSKKVPPSRKAIEVPPEEILSMLETIQTEFEPDGNDAEYDAEQSAKLEKIMSEFKAMRITDQEARRLEQLGEDLNDINQDPNRAGDEGIESDANFSDANFSDANVSDANFSDANVSDANVSDANLSGANSRG
ncbi:MAG: pentapeptide repeat-containing protein [Planctomycetota bacterium]|nr:MAG: pentapeptide repeat-containing protein [Planctomycetota bacterium]